MSVLPRFEHRRAETLDEALSTVGIDDVVYAGGTELLLAMRAGLYRPNSLIDVKRIPELGVIEQRGGTLNIGGAVTHQRVIDSPVVAGALPILSSVLRRVGNPRVRASGTLGGNLCFAEPKSDVGTLLIALEASVRLRSTSNERVVLVSDFLQGAYTTLRQDGEILELITVPINPSVRVVYDKFATMERPTAGVAVSLAPAGEVRIVVGAVGPVPQVVVADGFGSIDPVDIARGVDVIADVSGSERYKRHIVSMLIRRTLQQLKGGM